MSPDIQLLDDVKIEVTLKVITIEDAHTNTQKHIIDNM